MIPVIVIASCVSVAVGVVGALGIQKISKKKEKACAEVAAAKEALIKGINDYDEQQAALKEDDEASDSKDRKKE